MNIQGLFSPNVSNRNYESLKNLLRSRYVEAQNRAVLEQRIQQANALRASGRTPQQRRETMLKIQAEKKMASGPVGLCDKEVKEGKDPFKEPCWIEGIKERMNPLLQQVEAGSWQCDKDQLGPHQVVVYEAAKLMANTPVDRELGPTDRRGLLVYHNTGSGKTNTAMGIMAAFWATPRRIFFVTSLENQKNNPLSEYAKLALVFYPDVAEKVIFANAPYLPPKKLNGKNLWSMAGYKAEEPFKTPDGKTTTLKEWCATIGAAIISKRLEGGKIISFWVFAGATKETKICRLKKEPCVLIIDESQNMYKPHSQGNEEKALKFMADHLPTEDYMKYSFVFPLTATPGDTADQVVNMINVVRPYKMDRFSVSQFVANPAIARGLISYADVRGDPTHYGHLSGPERKPINKYVTLEPRYFAAMLAEMKTYTKESKDLNKNPGASKTFFIKSRVASCVLPAKKVKDLYKGDEAAFEKLLHAKGRGDVVFSSKMEAIFKAIENTKGCQYLYVPDPAVLLPTINLLQKRLGYERVKKGSDLYTKIEIDDKGKEVTVWKVNPNMSEKKRFYSFYPKTLAGEAGDANQMKSVLDFFKSSKNKYGERIKLFVGTVFEGLDMGWLQAVHLASPLPSTADDDQAVGRALRYCGHDVHAKEVAVYRYFGVAPRSLDFEMKPAKQQAVDEALARLVEHDERGVNVHVYRDALRRGKPMEEFMMCVRGQSIECEANSGSGGILGTVQYGERTKCHVGRCNVQLVGDKLVVDKHTPGKYTNSLPGGKPGGGIFGPKKNKVLPVQKIPTKPQKTPGLKLKPQTSGGLMRKFVRSVSGHSGVKHAPIGIPSLHRRTSSMPTVKPVARSMDSLRSFFRRHESPRGIPALPPRPSPRRTTTPAQPLIGLNRAETYHLGNFDFTNRKPAARWGFGRRRESPKGIPALPPRRR